MTAPQSPTTEALKPCPFCASERIRHCDTTPAGQHWFACGECECAGEGPPRDTEAEAISAWNTRPSPIAEPQDGDAAWLEELAAAEGWMDPSIPDRLERIAARLEAPIAGDAASDDIEMLADKARDALSRLMLSANSVDREVCYEADDAFADFARAVLSRRSQPAPVAEDALVEAYEPAAQEPQGSDAVSDIARARWLRGFADDLARCGRHAQDESDALRIIAARLEAPIAEQSAVFDLLEGLKEAWRAVDPKKAEAIATGFARATGGIDVPWLIEKLGPQPIAEDALVEALKGLLASCTLTTPGMHDDCGTRIVTTPTVDALKAAVAALQAIHEKKG